jgi:hypothetical protein
MELPEDVLALVREFSRPMTRPDWRTCKRNVANSLTKHCLRQCVKEYGAALNGAVLEEDWYNRYDFFLRRYEENHGRCRRLDLNILPDSAFQ